MAIMTEFCERYGREAVIYSPSVREGESGYVTEDFFLAVYGEEPESVSDFAVVFYSDLDSIGEAAVLICYTDYDALRATDTLRRRIDLLKTLGTGQDTSSLSDAFVMRSGRVVVMCALFDNGRARKCMEKIL
ncbi:MAG: hypothetical protein IJY23_05665 [Clostridia bacterium]|nr:hypothetical protein [Clostridia bacterium]